MRRAGSLIPYSVECGSERACFSALEKDWEFFTNETK